MSIKFATEVFRIFFFFSPNKKKYKMCPKEVTCKFVLNSRVIWNKNYVYKELLQEQL